MESGDSKNTNIDDTLVRITKDIEEKFVGTQKNGNGEFNLYGPFKYNDLLYIENGVAENLIKQGYAIKHEDYKTPLPLLENNGGEALDETFSVVFDEEKKNDVPTEEDYINTPSVKSLTQKGCVRVISEEGIELTGQYLKDTNGKLFTIDKSKYVYSFLSLGDIHHIHHIHHFLFLRVEFGIYNIKLSVNMDMLTMLDIPEELKDEEEIYIIRCDISSFFDIDPNIGTIKPSVFKVADFIKKAFSMLTFIDSEEMYWYNEGIYHPHGDNVVREISNIIFPNTKARFIEEIVKKVAFSTYVDRNDISTKNLICTLNGVIDINNFGFFAHNPKYILFSKIPVTYDTNAKCDKIVSFFNNILDGPDIILVEEMIGYCLLREYCIQKAIMLLGEGENGKSTLINLIKAFLGSKNVSEVSLQDLDRQRFAKANLYEKLANLCADIPSNALAHTGVFKMLTGGDTISAEKKFKESFGFVNHAKLIFSANELPMASDDTTAFFRRWVFLTFPHSFTGKDADKNILKKITTPVELSGLLNLALKGLKRLLEQSEFTGTKSNDEIRELYIRLSDPVASFCMDRIEVANPDDHEPKQDVYRAFCEYCKVEKLPAISPVVFSQRFVMKTPTARDGRPKIGKRQIHCWMGIKLKDKEPEDIDQTHIEEFDST